ncbi:V-type proton ATPase subunit H-like [Austrofundulus limnaeus]|uniref:V-type proton ATPase subunit H-like n=1 Tax=Austrofundulus limnaeus TaxID=52670 RepID=A0A2I4C1E8_AUSLI|nr:PREDICTED: V-type proton ATPase subunit H-like [Austrofundulus limnaeus]
MDIRGAVDAAVPTNIIAAKAAEVRANLVNWQSYLQSQMISTEDCEFIKKFEKANSEEKQLILTKEGHQVDIPLALSATPVFVNVLCLFKPNHGSM